MLHKSRPLEYLQRTQQVKITKEWGKINLKVNPLVNNLLGYIEPNLKSQPVRNNLFLPEDSKLTKLKSLTGRLRALSTFCLPTYSLRIINDRITEQPTLSFIFIQ